MKMLKKITALSLTALLFTSCYTWWEERIGLDASKEKTDLADFFYKAPQITELESPSQVIASKGYYSNCIKLRWSEVEYATSYRIERAVMPKGSQEFPEEGDFTVITEYVYDTTYTDVILSNPSAQSEAYAYQYYYRICAENISRGLESSEYSDITNERTKAIGWLLPPPQNIEASKGDSPQEITITWNKVEGANQYKIYRGETPQDFDMKELATVRGSQLFFVNSLTGEKEKGKEFYYQVSAIHAQGGVSTKSSYAMGYTLANASLKAPENLRISGSPADSNSFIKLEWDELSGDRSNITYSVYKTTDTDSSFRLVKQNIPATTTSLTDDDNLKPGVIYYYYIQSVKTNGETKEKSAFSKKGPYSFILSNPTEIETNDEINLEGSVSSQYVKLCWKPALGSASSSYDLGMAFKYNIYYSDTEDGSFSMCINGSPLENLPLNENGLFEYSVPKKGFYKITTINSQGEESQKSKIVAPVPDAPKNVRATKTQGGNLLTDYRFESTGENYNKNEVYPVKITWEIPDSNPIPAGYNIYRSTKRDSSFRKLNDELITDCEFIDMNETARAGTYYYYKVVSINSLGQGQKSNDPTLDTENQCRGYGAITREQWFREYNLTVMRSQSKLTYMHKPSNTDKMGTETISGDLSGTLYYTVSVVNFEGDVTMRYTNYSDYWAGDNPENGPYFLISGNTNTRSNMSGNGHMYGTVTVSGMYPGITKYDNLTIKSGSAGGGGYTVETQDLEQNIILQEKLVNWVVGEEGK